jgi:hypothetical protein
MIARIVERHPEVQSSGFWRAMRTLPDADYVPDLLTNDPGYLRDFKFIPDAWALDVDNREVTLFEVVDTHDVPAEKMARIVNFSFALDEDRYSLGLIRVDITGPRVYDCRNLGIEMGAMRDTLDCAERYRGWQAFTTPHRSA